MAVPKKAKSKSARDMRRAHHALTSATVVACPNCGESMLLHRICPACGHYRGKEVVKYEESEE